jgi:hypothetical protein
LKSHISMFTCAWTCVSLIFIWQQVVSKDAHGGSAVQCVCASVEGSRVVTGGADRCLVMSVCLREYDCVYVCMYVFVYMNMHTHKRMHGHS